MRQRWVGTRLLAAGLFLSGILTAAYHFASPGLIPRTAVHVSYGDLNLSFPSTTINGRGASATAPHSSRVVAHTVFWNRGISAPNYVGSLEGLQRWRRFPVSVVFPHDANYSLRRQEEALAGFQQWTAATNGKVSFRLRDASGAADIMVRFDSARVKSETITQYDVRRDTLYHADIYIGMTVDDGSGAEITPGDVRELAAHEFGHALGIDGHSPDPGDLMYHSLGNTNRAVTARDLNTLRKAYSPAFS
ncbi:MAG TPA: matrixin family metalloprotease [Armatimonadota bacterium]|nr:matrixin family metalloprotease [Armatimonadota bacterium]